MCATLAQDAAPSCRRPASTTPCTTPPAGYWTIGAGCVAADHRGQRARRQLRRRACSRRLVQVQAEQRRRCCWSRYDAAGRGPLAEVTAQRRPARRRAGAGAAAPRRRTLARLRLHPGRRPTRPPLHGAAGAAGARQRDGADAAAVPGTGSRGAGCWPACTLAAAATLRVADRTCEANDTREHCRSRQRACGDPRAQRRRARSAAWSKARCAHCDRRDRDRRRLRRRHARELHRRPAGDRCCATRSACGKGAALRDGFREALRHGFDAVLTMDGDGQHLRRRHPAPARRRQPLSRSTS